MRERNGVRLGQRVRDLDGTPMGRVTRLYDAGFAVRKGLPILFRRDFVARYDELRGVRDGELVIARSRRDLLDLASGGLPSSWRVPAPADFPTAATPSEACALREELARGALAVPPARAPAAVAQAEEPPAVEEESAAPRRGETPVAAPAARVAVARAAPSDRE